MDQSQPTPGLLLFSCFVDSFATPWTVALQSPLSMGISKQEYWSGLHFLLQWPLIVNHKLQ